MKIRIFFILIYICIITITASAQRDTVFWFAVPDVSQDGINSLDRPISIKLSTLNQSAIVTIEQPANGGMPVQNITIPANNSSTVVLTNWINFLENTPANTILNRGLKITSDVPITAYFDNTSSNNPETFVLKGKNALGQEFYIPGQNLFNNHTSYTPLPSNSFDIVATEDNTTVTINPRRDIVGHAAGVPFTITLNKGQTYSATATSVVAAQHLVGSYVSSDKPIAITVKDDLLGGAPLSGNCADLTGDQITPIHIQGTEYIAINNGLLTGSSDYIFITATEDNTTFSVNGTANPTTLNRGETFSMQIPGSTAYIVASRNVYVYQISGRQCELGGAILPQIKCTGSNSVSFVRSAITQLYVGILVESAGINDFTINGTPITPGSFTPIPSTGNSWYFAVINLPVGTYPQNSLIIINNALSRFQLANINDNPGGTSYGYFSDYGKFTAITNVVTNPACTGGSVQFFTNNGSGLNYQWTGPDGFTSTDANPVINNIQAVNAGKYFLTVTGACASVDSTELTVLPPLSLNIINNDTIICAKDNFNLSLQANVNTGASYYWDGPNGFTSTIASPSLTLNNANQSGYYYLTCSMPGFCDTKDSVLVTIGQPTAEAFPIAPNFCEGATIELTAYNGGAPNTSYTWTGPNSFLSTSNPVIVSTNAGIVNSGWYYVHTTDNISGCTSTKDSLLVTVLPLHNGHIINNDTMLCAENFVHLNTSTSVPGTTTIWNGPLFFNSTLPNPSIYMIDTAQSGYYVVTFRANGYCDIKDSILIKVKSLPLFSFAAIASTYCEGDSIKLSATNISNAGYGWTGPNSFTSNVYNPVIYNARKEQSGYHHLVVTGANGCTYTDSLNVSVFPYLKNAILTNDTSICRLDSLILRLADVPGATYTWTGPNGFSTTGNNVKVIFNNANQSGRYIVSASAPNYCPDKDTVNITYLNLPTVIASNDTSICDKIELPLHATGAENYVWFPDLYIDNIYTANPYVTPPVPITYTVWGVDSNSCRNKDSVTVKVLQTPDLNVSASTTKLNCREEIQLYATGAEFYHWLPMDFFSNPRLSDPTVNISNTTTFHVIAYNDSACSVTDSITIEYTPGGTMFIPNAFTPNYDGLNDKFGPKLFCDYDVKLFIIYDRWGNEIFTTTSKNHAWDGTVKGQKANAGSYFWMFKGLDPQGSEVLRKGDVLLIR